VALADARMEETAFAEGRGPNPATKDKTIGNSGVAEDPLGIAVIADQLTEIAHEWGVCSLQRSAVNAERLPDARLIHHRAGAR
jgi:hypothetical protein